MLGLNRFCLLSGSEETISGWTMRLYHPLEALYTAHTCHSTSARNFFRTLRTMLFLTQGQSHRVSSTRRVCVIVICAMFATLLTPTRRTPPQQQLTPLPSSTSTHKHYTLPATLPLKRTPHSGTASMAVWPLTPHAQVMSPTWLVT